MLKEKEKEKEEKKKEEKVVPIGFLVSLGSPKNHDRQYGSQDTCSVFDTSRPSFSGVWIIDLG